jgi:hypothetical protein
MALIFVMTSARNKKIPKCSEFEQEAQWTLKSDFETDHHKEKKLILYPFV